MIYYGTDFNDDIIVKDLRRLINQIWKLLPMRENNEDWQKQRELVLIEIRGLSKMFGDELNFLIVISCLEGLTNDVDFMIYRSEIFSMISMMTEIANALDDRKSRIV